MVWCLVIFPFARSLTIKKVCPNNNCDHHRSKIHIFLQKYRVDDMNIHTICRLYLTKKLCYCFTSWLVNSHSYSLNIFLQSKHRAKIPKVKVNANINPAQSFWYFPLFVRISLVILFAERGHFLRLHVGVSLKSCIVSALNAHTVFGPLKWWNVKE